MGGTFPTNCAGDEFPLEGIDCDEKKKDPPTSPKWTDCMCKELCAKVKAFNNRKKPKKRITPSPSRPKSPLQCRLQCREGQVRRELRGSRGQARCFVAQGSEDVCAQVPLR